MWGWQVVPEGWSSAADPQDHFCPDTHPLPGSWAHFMSKHTNLPWWPTTPDPPFPSCLGDSSKGRRWGHGASPMCRRWAVLLESVGAVAYVIHEVWARNVKAWGGWACGVMHQQVGTGAKCLILSPWPPPHHALQTSCPLPSPSPACLALLPAKTWSAVKAPLFPRSFMALPSRLGWS